MATALALAAYLWQVAYPTPTLAALYEQVPEWGHVALDSPPASATCSEPRPSASPPPESAHRGRSGGLDSALPRDSI